MSPIGVWVAVLSPREVAVELLGVLVGIPLLPFGEVAAQRIVDGRVAGLLTLGEVAAVLFLEGIALFLLAGGKAAVLVVIAIVVVIAMVVVVVVVGMFAHARVSQRYVWAHCGPRVKWPQGVSARDGAAPQEANAHLDGERDGGHDQADIESKRHVRPQEAERRTFVLKESTILDLALES
jgi:hypothetical protein